MQFVFVMKGRGASVPQTLVTDRLLVVATRETVHRKRHGRDRDKKKYAGAGPTAAGAPLQISGIRLRDLCWSASQLSASLSIEKDDLAFHCAIAQTPYVQRRADAELDTVPLRFIVADDLEHVYFNVHEDLLQEGRLVVFTHADNLMHVGIDADAWAEARAAAASAAGSAEVGTHATATTSSGSGGGAGEAAAGGGGANEAHKGGDIGSSSTNNTPSEEAAAAANAQKRQHRSGMMWEEEGRAAVRRLDALHTPHSHFKKEQVLAVVPATVSSDDIKELNELMDQGKITSLDASLADFFCCQCGHLPLLTLTMSCCGAVLCQQCAPTPPTVEGVPAVDRACPVCAEEPLDPPLSHPNRDSTVAKLVKELKVLYYPQLQASRESQQPSTEASTPSTPPFFQPNTPILGSR